ncbi:MAG TPA: S41 family peptidase [Vicinamibacteria bacterium]|nr:S41 family peptidase [Vicinamibacteria bacterium]
MKKVRVKHILLAFSAPFVLYAILGGFLGRAIAREGAYRYLSVFQDVVTLIMNNYVTPPDMDKVMDGAIRGMMDALDPDSCYLTPEQYSAFKDPSSHAKADIGVELSKRYYLQVVAVLAGSPAETAGVEAGDLIKAIDGENTREVNVIVGDSMLKGAAGSVVSLEIIRGRQADSLEIKVARRDVVASPVSFELLEDGTGYIKITSFRSGVEIDTKRGIELLKKQGARAIVLDVRNSFGRLAEDGARVAELFIDGGLAARLQSRKGETSDLQLDRGSVAFSGPVALLINRGSSGSAEILASAFRTAKRGEILGVPTSGRVGVQKAISLGDGSGLVLSVAQYWTPDGKALLGEGLEPTIEVAGSEEPESEDEDPVLDKALEVLGEAAQKKAA